MSGHLLETVNPMAVAPPDPESLPTIGDWVIYVARPGEGRRGRHEFPALVLTRNDIRGRTGLDLIICYDANDVVFRDSVQMLDENYDNSCWKYRPHVELPDEVIQLREENAALRRAVFGDGGETAKPLVDCLVDFEKTIKGLQADVEKLTQARSTGKAAKAK